MRSLASSLITELESGVTTPITLVEIMTPTPLRVAREAISAVARTFTAASVQVSVQGAGATVRVFNEDGTLGSTVISEGVAGAGIRIWQTYKTGAVQSNANLLMNPTDLNNASWIKDGDITVTPSDFDGWQTLEETDGLRVASVYQTVVVPSGVATYTMQIAVRKNSAGGKTLGWDFSRNTTGGGGPDRTPEILFDASDGTVLAGTCTVESSGDAWILTQEKTKDSDHVELTMTIAPTTNNSISSSISSGSQGQADFRAPLLRAGAEADGVEHPVLLFEGTVNSATVGDYVEYQAQQFPAKRAPHRRITEQDYPDIGTVKSKNAAV